MMGESCGGGKKVLANVWALVKLSMASVLMWEAVFLFGVFYASAEFTCHSLYSV